MFGRRHVDLSFGRLGATARITAVLERRPGQKAIVAFVSRVVTAAGSEYVEPAERIAVFDDDGTLWSEQPIYVPFAFALDRVKALHRRIPSGRARSRSRPC